MATRVGRRIFIHINNTNPVLDPDGPHRGALEAAGCDPGRNGMEIAL